MVTTQYTIRYENKCNFSIIFCKTICNLDTQFKLLMILVGIAKTFSFKFYKDLGNKLKLVLVAIVNKLITIILWWEYIKNGYLPSTNKGSRIQPLLVEFLSCKIKNMSPFIHMAVVKSITIVSWLYMYCKGRLLLIENLMSNWRYTNPRLALVGRR